MQDRRVPAQTWLAVYSNRQGIQLPLSAMRSNWQRSSAVSASKMPTHISASKDHSNRYRKHHHAGDGAYASFSVVPERKHRQGNIVDDTDIFMDGHTEGLENRVGMVALHTIGFPSSFSSPQQIFIVRIVIGATTSLDVAWDVARFDGDSQLHCPVCPFRGCCKADKGILQQAKSLEVTLNRQGSAAKLLFCGRPFLFDWQIF